jgi:PhnB protein
MSSTTVFPVVQSYLNFDGRCEEAIEFYKKAVGAEVEMMLRFKDNPEKENCAGNEGNDNKIMHSSFRIGSSVVMASDCHATGKTEFKGFSLSFSVATPADAEKAAQALSDGGKVEMPLTKTFFSPSFGMVTDRFGINWMIMACPPQK